MHIYQLGAPLLVTETILEISYWEPLKAVHLKTSSLISFIFHKTTMAKQAEDEISIQTEK